jgi:hypothetical protein
MWASYSVSGDPGADRVTIPAGGRWVHPGQGHSGDLLRDAHGGGCAADRLGRVWFSERPDLIPDEKFDELFAAFGSHRDRLWWRLWDRWTSRDALARRPRPTRGEAPETGRRSASVPWLPVTVWVRRW